MTDGRIRRPFKHAALWLILLGFIALAALALWALYGLEIGPVSGLDVPLPAASHAIPWLRLREHMAGGHAAFLMGKISHQGSGKAMA
jgi:hypothetical protein